MKKKLLIIFLVISLVIGLAACTTDDQVEKDAKSDLTDNQNEKTESQSEPQVKVPVDLEIVKNNQEQVDKGSSPWQLDPLQVTMTFVSLQISPDGIYGDFPINMDDLKISTDQGSKVVVEVNSDLTGITKVYLEQLVKQGEGGIWTVVGYDFDETRTPSIAGIRLGESKDKVLEILGDDYAETKYEEAGHFSEKFTNWEYADGFIISIGQESGKVFQIMATSPTASTNLGIKVGDSAEKTLNTYRAKYLEPESIHGGKLYGVFKVENGQAIIFDFNIDDGIVNPPEEIDPAEKLERIILTYPSYLDDSF